MTVKFCAACSHDVVQMTKLSNHAIDSSTRQWSAVWLTPTHSNSVRQAMLEMSCSVFCLIASYISTHLPLIVSAFSAALSGCLF